MAHEWTTYNPTTTDSMALGELQSPKESMEGQTEDQFKKGSNCTSGICQEITHEDLKAAVETTLNLNQSEIDFLKDQGDHAMTPKKSPLLGDTVPDFDIETHMQALTDDPSSASAFLDEYSDVSSCSETADEQTLNSTEIFDSEEMAKTHETLSTKNRSMLDGPPDGDDCSTLKPDFSKSTVLSCENNQRVEQEGLLEDQYSNISSPEPEVEKEASDLIDEKQDEKQDLSAASESVSNDTLEVGKSGEDPPTADSKETNTSDDFHDVDGNMDTLAVDRAPAAIDEVLTKTIPSLGSKDDPTTTSPLIETLDSGNDNGSRNESNSPQFSSDLELERGSFEKTIASTTTSPLMETLDSGNDNGSRNESNSPQFSSDLELERGSFERTIPALDSKDDPTTTSPLKETVDSSNDNGSRNESNSPQFSSDLELERGSFEKTIPALDSKDDPTTTSPLIETVDSSNYNRNGANSSQFNGDLELERGSFEFLETCLKNSENGIKSSYNTVENVKTVGLTVCVKPNHTNQSELNSPKQEQPRANNSKELGTAADSSMSGTCDSESQDVFKAQSDETELRDDATEQDDSFKQQKSCLNLDEGSSLLKVECLIKSYKMKKKLDPIVLLDYGEPKNSHIGIYRCAQCRVTAETVDHVIEHHHQHTQYHFQFCQTCGCFLTSRHLAERHRCGHHELTGPQISSKSLQQSTDDSTKPTKGKKLYKCSVCPLMFSKKKSYQIHYKRHKTKTPYKCHQCSSYFSQTSSLRRHQRLNRCINISFFSERNASHTVKTMVKPTINTPFGPLQDCYVKLVDMYKRDPGSHSNTCYICNKKFKLRAQLNSHIKTHTSEKPYKCDDCCKAFKYSWNLNRHRREQCGRTPKTGKGVQPVCGEQDEKMEDAEVEGSVPSKQKMYPKYKCPLCPSSFKYFYNLFRHLRVQCLKEYTKIDGKGKTDSGYKCPLCNAVFTLVCNLNRHIKNICLPLFKSNKKMIKSEPEKKSKPKGSMIKKTQFSGNYYKCKLCPAVFCHSSGLNKHSRKHRLAAKTGKPVRYRTANPEDLKVTAHSDQTKEDKLACRFCGKRFTESNSLKKHMSLHRGDKPYICQKCGKRFKKQAYLIAHSQSHKRKVQCSVCNKMFATIADFLQHRESHDSKAMLKCPDCQMEFRFPVYLLRHMVTHERKDKLEVKQTKKAILQPVQESDKKPSPVARNEEFRCALCQKSFADSKSLSDHCVVHLPKSSSSKCQYCKRCFSSRNSLVRHIRLHTGEKPFSCNKCGKYFRRVEPMRAHMEHCNGSKMFTRTNDAVKATAKTEKIEVKQGLHKVKKTFKCPHCPHSFVWISSLTKHLNGHKLKLLAPCSKCARCYRKTILDSHEKDCNGKESNTVTLFPCKKCGKSFSRINNKNVHEKTCKGAALTNVKKSSQKILTASKDKLAHRCPHCPKSFKYKSYLLKHLPSHMAEKPYTCMHCGHKYADQRRYLQHEAFCDGVFRRKSVSLQEVTKDEPKNITAQDGIGSAETDNQYRCKFCNKNFAKARNLRRHILTHTDVKPYRCKSCDSCFSRYDHLKVHQGRCKGKKPRLEVRLPKVSHKDVGTGWQNSIEAKQKEVFQCKTCSKEFTSQINLARHESLLHSTHKPFSCKRCGSSFSSASSLKKHTLVVNCKRATPITSAKVENTKVTEQQCRETAKLLQRIQGHYSSKLKFQCSYCPRRFKSQTHVQVHTRLHTGERPFGCENCGERFIRRDYLQRHLVKCTSKREDTGKELCDKCGQLFSEQAIKSHKSNCVVKTKEIKKGTQTTPSTPPKIRTFSCTNCCEKFLLFSQLQQHFLSKHREEPVQKSSVVSQDVFLKKEDGEYNDYIMSNDDSKPYSCQYCGLRFLNSSGLGMHVRTHTAAYPLSCQKCKKGFWSKNVLKRHVRKCQGKMETTVIPAVSSELVSKDGAVLLFNKGSNTTGTGVLQTQFSCKDGNKKPQRKGEHSSAKGHLSEEANTTTNKYQCSECDESFTDGLLLISHLENHGREDLLKMKFRCDLCGREHDSQKALSRHMGAQHGVKAPRVNTCRICSKTFRFPSDLEAHKSCHDPNRPFCCSTCSLRFWSQKSLNLHVSMSHPKLQGLTCHPCNKTYLTRKSYIRHQREKHRKSLAKDSGQDKGSGFSADRIDVQHDINDKSDVSDVSVKDENEASEDDDSDSAPYFPCHVCGKSFSTSESLEDHQRCHLGEKPHECEECGKCFFQLVNLQQHQRSHKSEFQCQTCGRGFVSLFALRKHKHSHGKSRPHRCTKCHLSFTGPSQLAEHMATHRDENFPCDLCDRTFSCKITRAEHRKTHTEQEEEIPPLISPSSTPPLTLPPSTSSSSSPPRSGEQTGFKYHCGVCRMRFKDPEQLSEHGCKAAKERPYACPECDQHFLHGSHLKKHQLSHQLAGPYRYQCNQCHMNFTYRHHFLSHIRRHGSDKDSGDATGDGDEVPTKNSEPDNIYQCPICPQRYSQAMELADHLSVHSFMCKVCNMTFSSKAELASHEQCHLTATTQYECTECAESFYGSDAFRQHQCAQRQRLHVENKTEQLSSPTSQKQISRSSRGVEEEEEVDVGEDFYNCKVCKKRFSSEADLEEHQKISKECRPYKCQVCGKGFTKGRYLSRHQLIHERPFRCGECTMSFDSESSLVAHQGHHNVARDLQCSVCHKRYATASDLTRHERKHAFLQKKKSKGIHCCDMCYKSFGTLSRLQKHQLTHNGEVVYECMECDKAFAFYHLLEEHERTHVPDVSSTSSPLQNPEIDQL